MQGRDHRFIKTVWRHRAFRWPIPFVWIVLSSFVSAATNPRTAVEDSLGSPQAPAADAATWALASDNGTTGFRWEDAFGDLQFENPVAIAIPPGETNRLFVVERTGLIKVITNLAQPMASVFLDIRTNLHAQYLEAGVLGLAFHPGYATNRQFFVFRTTLEPARDGVTRIHDVLARFETFPDDPFRADPASEARLIVQEDALDTHNGGDLHFGPDGYLYVSLGDEHPPAWQNDGNLQPLTVFFGAILRIDVDQRPGNLPPNPHPGVPGGYSIPADNPFIGLTRFAGRPVDPSTVRTEFYAIGFRNPWRISFDEQTGRLLVGDVGESSVEELDLIRPGGNYGWPYREGNTNASRWFLEPPGLQFEPPVAAYRHGSATNEGNSVIAGIWYHGNRLRGLQGTHIFADCRSGHTWALHLSSDGLSGSQQWLCTEPGLVTFARDPRDGEVLAANYRTGKLRRLSPIPTDDRPMPDTLQETGVFRDLVSLEPAPELIPYEINAPFWSDHALKTRWVGVPSGPPTQDPMDGSLRFPSGTVWVKHFELELVPGAPESRRRLETRLLIQATNGVQGVTYRWRDDQRNADLVPPGGFDETFLIREGNTIRTQVWHYPGRGECIVCHTEKAGHVLGYIPSQLNRRIVVNGEEVSQVEHLRAMSALPPDLPPSAEIPSLVNPGDAALPLEERVRSYFTANCSGCHRPGSLIDTTASWDARLSTPLKDMGLLNGKLIIPRNTQDSRLIHVVERTAPDLSMPPLATKVHDEGAIALLKQWVEALPEDGWYRDDVGAFSVPGFSLLGTNPVIGSSAPGPDAPQPGYHFLRRFLRPDSLLEARLDRWEPAGPSSLAGLRIEWGYDSNRTSVSLALDANQRLFLFTNSASIDRQPVTPTTLALALPVRFRVEIHSDTIVVSAKSENTLQEFRTSVPAGGDLAYEAGFFASSGHGPAMARAWLHQVQAASAFWMTPTPDSAIQRGVTIPLRVDASAAGTSIQRVEFVADDALIGSAEAPPFLVNWSNASPGSHALMARILLPDGSIFTTRPVWVDVLPTTASFRGEDRSTHGDWLTHYGETAYELWSVGSRPSDLVSIIVPGVATQVIDNNSASPAALLSPDGSKRTAAFATREVTIDIHLTPADLLPQRLGLYFVDWTAGGEARQTIEVLDAETGAVLDVRTLVDFSQGVYLTWRFIGPVRVRITSEGAGPPTITGIFLDRRSPGAGAVRITSPANDVQVVAPGPLLLRAEAINPDSPPAHVAFLIDGQVIADATGPDFSATWNNAWFGEHQLIARASDRIGEVVDSEPVRVLVQRASARGMFVGTDAMLGGSWVNGLGAKGYLVAPGFGQLAPDVRVASEARTYIWAGLGLTGDPRAPMIPQTDARVAACWVDTDLLTIDVDLLNGRPHLLTLYLVDWDTNLREQRIEIVEPGTDHVLASYDASGFFPGRYVGFIVQGAVQVRVRPMAVNAVVSGIFLDELTLENRDAFGIDSIQLSPSEARLEWNAPAGSVFRVVTTNALGIGWAALPDLVTSTNGRFQYLDRHPRSFGRASRFYRLEALVVGDPLRP